MKRYGTLLTILVVGLLILSANSASAYTFATSGAWDAGDGAQIGNDQRGELSNAFGAPDDDFLSLGLGGAAVFDFGVEFNATAIVFETTWGNRSGYREYADVYVADSSFSFTSESDPGGDADLLPHDPSFTLVGSINNQSQSSILELDGGPFRYVLIVDTTLANQGTRGDGFDIDAVGVTPVPEPSTVLLLGAGMIGFAGIRRKLKK